MVEIGSAGVLAPGKWRWLRALAWMVALCVAIVIAYNAVARATLTLITRSSGISLASSSDAPAGYRLAAGVAGSVGLIAIYWLAVRFGERRSVPELNLRHAPSELLAGLAIGTAAMVLIVGALWLFGWVAIEAKAIDSVDLALRDSIRSGVLEELILRLVVFRLLWRAFGIWPAIAVAAVTFGALHLINPDGGLVPTLCLIAGEGIGIGLYLITGRIWAAMGMHAGWNFAQGWLFGAVVSGTSEIAGGPLSLRPATGVPQFLSGGGFGPEASLAALVVSLAASMLFLTVAWKRGHFAPAGAAVRA